MTPPGRQVGGSRGATSDRRGRRRSSKAGSSNPTARRVALDALDRIDAEGAYANLALRPVLDKAGLSPRDRHFVTELVYGTTRQRRACDFLVDRFLTQPTSGRVRNALRLGAYQLAFARLPAHAAVGETVEVVPRSARGLVNAVLRRVAKPAEGEVEWPDDATRLSYPDWVVDRLCTDLGHGRAMAALEAMNEPATVTERDDGYVQDPASQQVAAAVEARAGDRVLDVCAAPGGKATAIARSGAWVVAADVRPSRLELVQANAARLAPGQEGVPVADAVEPPLLLTSGPGLGSGSLTGDAWTDEARLPPGARGRAGEGRGRLAIAAADGTNPPWRAGAFGWALVDAPCSGLGTLRRRADLRWRVDENAVERLAELQRRLVAATVPLVRPGGVLVYSVCTLTDAESLGVDEHIAVAHPELVPLDPLGAPWEPWGRGAILLPQTAGTDGMCLFRYRRLA
jgi:16S rRNA (cytosine967-C5)-methyltransferase